jgi:hypothetical protein
MLEDKHRVWHNNNSRALEGEIRSRCGKLLVRWTAKGYEIKCGRCKQIELLPFEPDAARLRTLPIY